ncbi:hypothetical protein JKF63_04657 [Porcisia hertigi]|uniref:Uncharacterized protein n=1 Tax=Porcisia hertigi TaxID=2761500 RepID=A0A836IPX2_9TRYP|nr:hypothetical protein JKF63_04657 [Porcisia hertigi]
MEIASSTLKSLIEPLIDLIHGDLVLKDTCCQRVAHALVERHDAALRRVVTSHALPNGLEKAIEAYLVRSYLINTPELLTQSHKVTEMLQQLADTLIDTARALKGVQRSGGVEKEKVRREDEGAEPTLAEIDEVGSGSAAYFLVTSGETIKEDVAALQVQPEAQRCTHLIDALGEVVLGYIMCAAQECAQRAHEYLDGASWQDTQVAHSSYHAALHQFVKSAMEHREARKREREAAQEAEVQALLFGRDHAASVPAVSNERGDDIEEGDSIRIREDDLPDDAHSSPYESSDADFAAQVQAAMESPPPSAQPPQQQQQLTLKAPTPHTTRNPGKRRLLHSVNDSVSEQCEALMQMTPPATLQEEENQPTPRQSLAPIEPTSSPEIIVDPLSVAAALGTSITSAKRWAPHVDDNNDDDDRTRKPHKKVHRAEAAPIGDSVRSPLRTMNHANGEGSEVCYLSATAASDFASMPSSTLPVGAQRTHDGGGTTGDTVSSANSTVTSTLHVADEKEGMWQCLQKQNAESRSYFLCPATHRFEPYVAKGFF